VRLDRTIGPAVYVLHRWVYDLSRGLVGHRSGSGPVLLLTTTGRRTRRRRTKPLLYMPLEDGRLAVVASNGGRDKTPDWWHNLTADPQVEVRVGRRRFGARAELLDADSRQPLWPRLTSFYKGWAHYETLTRRRAGVAVLTPSAESP